MGVSLHSDVSTVEILRQSRCRKSTPGASTRFDESPSPGHEAVATGHLFADRFVGCQSSPERPLSGNTDIWSTDRVIENLDYPFTSIHGQSSPE
jgi:hypothetical protein